MKTVDCIRYGFRNVGSNTLSMLADPSCPSHDADLFALWIHDMNLMACFALKFKRVNPCTPTGTEIRRVVIVPNVRRKAKGILEVDRVTSAKSIQIHPTREPDGIFVREPPRSGI